MKFLLFGRVPFRRLGELPTKEIQISAAIVSTRGSSKAFLTWMELRTATFSVVEVVSFTRQPRLCWATARKFTPGQRRMNFRQRIWQVPVIFKVWCIRYRKTWLAPAHHSNGPSSDREAPRRDHVSFYDGHVEQVKLERLWSLYWHKDYVPPVKRPGL
jgi:hypothetical protein